jgi:hypothetical protein
MTFWYTPEIEDILTGTIEDVPELSASEQYVLVIAIAQAMNDSQTEVDEATWREFCDNVGNFAKEYLSDELLALLYWQMLKHHGISFTNLKGTVLHQQCSEIRDVLRKMI